MLKGAKKNKDRVFIRNGNFPGPESKKILRLGERYYATTTVSSLIVPGRAKGAKVWDVDGNEYIDFVAGVGVASTGYGNAEIKYPLTDHLAETGIINFIHHDFYNPWATQLAKKMAQRMELYFEKRGEAREFKMFFANSGAEIIEAALKLIWDNRPTKQKIIGFKGAFHGRTMGAWTLLTKDVHIKNYPQYLRRALISHLTFPKDRASFGQFKDELVSLPLREYSAMFMEIIQGEGGLNPLYPPAAEFIQKEMAEKHGIYLVIDEVQTGNGRTGKYMAFEHYSVLKPTIVVTAKGAASGMPFAAMWFPKEMDWKEKGRHSSTYGGNALACVAAGATLNYIDKHKLIRRVERMGHILRAELLKLEEGTPYIRNVRGFGLMQGFDFVYPDGSPFTELRDKVEAEAPRWGLILMRCGQSGIRILPPLVITEEELREGFRRLRYAINYVIEWGT